MAGVKGKSGRRARSVEESHKAVIDKAWAVVTEYLNDEEVALKDKIEVATKVVLKDMPSQPLVNVDASTHRTYVTVYLPGKSKARRQGMEALSPAGDISPE